MDPYEKMSKGAFQRICKLYEDTSPKPDVDMEIPDKILQSAAIAGIQRDDIDRMTPRLIAMWLFSRKAISQGQAAEWVQMHPGEFIQLLKEFTVSLVAFDDEDLKAELDFIESIIK